MLNESKHLEVDRRIFLRAAALVVPISLAAQSSRAESERQSKIHEPRRREKAMGTGGLSKARLGRMHDVMAGYVERGDVPGIVTLVSRRGEVHVDAIGMKASGGSAPIRRDTIFRISSMTKPITAAAT